MDISKVLGVALSLSRLTVTAPYANDNLIDALTVKDIDEDQANTVQTLFLPNLEHLCLLSSSFPPPKLQFITAKELVAMVYSRTKHPSVRWKHAPPGKSTMQGSSTRFLKRLELRGSQFSLNETTVSKLEKLKEFDPNFALVVSEETAVTAVDSA
jgi:hypothetical protein